MRAKYVSVIAAALVATALLDLWSTYLATPDLARELNPLVVGLGLGWTAIVFLHAAFLCILLVGLLYFHRREPPRASLPLETDTVGKAFVWYLTGSSGEGPSLNGSRYLVFLSLFVPLGAIANAVANSALNLTFYYGLHGGLTASTATLFNVVKMGAIFCYLWAFFYIYMKKAYLGNRSQ